MKSLFLTGRIILCAGCLYIPGTHAALDNHSEASDTLRVAPTLQPEFNEVDKVDDSLGDMDLFESLRLKSAVQITHRPTPEKVHTCDICHRSSLHTSNSYLPILQGQNQEYIFYKTLFFKMNKNSFHPFPMYLQQLSNVEIMDISLYYSGQNSDLSKDLVIAEEPSLLADTQRKNTVSECAQCHGVKGNGTRLVPAISGQNVDYLSYRIREISRNNSKVHLKPITAVNCSVSISDVRESKQLANQLTLVLDDSSVKRGEHIYRNNCARCHDQGAEGAPKLSDTQNWSKRVRLGTRELVKSTIIGKNKMPFWGGNIRLSRNQLKDAIHFMIHQASTIH